MILKPQPLQDGNQIKFNKKYAIYFQKPQEPDARQIILELPNIFTVENCMEFCIDQFNQEDPNLHLVWRPENFRLKVAKKNGKPKDDLPALDGEQLIIDTGASVFALIQTSSVEKQQTFAPSQQQPQQQQQQQQQQEQSIKQRTSYSNSLSNNKSKKNKSEMNNSKADGNGFCFFKQCA